MTGGSGRMIGFLMGVMVGVVLGIFVVAIFDASKRE